ncbi:MAG: hypothetical protein K1X94_18385 [Sandaracinaceae bacterium]|nr:hypothetical protein [Sandaracinaceae bacterium]
MRPTFSTLACASLALLGWLHVAPVAAQAPELLDASLGPVTVDTRWIEGTPRRAEIDLSRGTTRIPLYAGRTVRTASAVVGEIVAVAYFHGGPEPFAGVVLYDLAHTQRREIEIPVSGAASPLRPAGIVIAPEPDSFAIVMQEQQADVQADVHSVFGRLALDGTWRAAPHTVSIPWGLAALAASTEGRYELAVLFGGWGGGAAGEARICIVTLSPGGEPTEHPWWASASAALTDVRLVQTPRALELYYRTMDGALRRHRFAADGAWGQEPAAADRVRQLGPSQGFYLHARPDGEIEVVAP